MWLSNIPRTSALDTSTLKTSPSSHEQSPSSSGSNCVQNTIANNETSSVAHNPRRLLSAPDSLRLNAILQAVRIHDSAFPSGLSRHLSHNHVSFRDKYDTSVINKLKLSIDTHTDYCHCGKEVWIGLLFGVHVETLNLLLPQLVKQYWGTRRLAVTRFASVVSSSDSSDGLDISDEGLSRTFLPLL